MNFERIAAEIRPRSSAEAIDLGLRMARTWWRPTFLPVLGVVVLVVAVAAVVAPGSPWIASLALWWSKPALDRMPIVALSRGLFGDAPAAGRVLHSLSRNRAGLLASLSWMRLDPFRAVRLPIRLLEGLRGRRRREREESVMRGVSGPAVRVLWVFSLFEACVTYGVALLAAQAVFAERVEAWIETTATYGAMPLPTVLGWTLVVAHAVGVSFVEPLFASAGFGVYVNRRARLEAWDVEVAFRKIVARRAESRPRIRPVGSVALLLAACVSLGAFASSSVAEASDAERDASVRAEAARVLAHPDFGTTEVRETWRVRPFELDLGSGTGSGLVTAAGSIVKVAAVLVLLGVGVAIAIGIARSLASATSPGPTPAAAGSSAPESIAGHDVRRESLPDDIVTAARSRLETGDPRGAIALLYRGALVELVHRHGLRLSPRATETECAERSREVLNPAAAAFFERLTVAWQHTAYAHRPPTHAGVTALTDAWSSTFRAAP